MGTASIIYKRIEWIINVMEPRIEIQRLDVIPNVAEDGFDISLNYLIIATNINDTITHFFKRVR